MPGLLLEGLRWFDIGRTGRLKNDSLDARCRVVLQHLEPRVLKRRCLDFVGVYDFHDSGFFDDVGFHVLVFSESLPGPLAPGRGWWG